MGQLFYTKWNCDHRSNAIGEFNLELQSGIAEFG